MNTLQIILLIIGVLCFAGSFFITEKLSSSDVELIKKLSQKEVKELVNAELADAQAKLSLSLDEKVNDSIARIETGTDEDFTHKMLSMGEYYDNEKEEIKKSLDALNKSHEQVMFLYNMLNEKQDAITGIVSDIAKQESNLRSITEGIDERIEDLREFEVDVQQKADALEAENEMHFEENIQSLQDAFRQKLDEDKGTLPEGMGSLDKEDEKSKIIAMSKEGYSEVEIAKKLGVGLGEIKLILGLF